MKKILKILGLLIGAIILLGAGFFGVAAVRPMKTFPVESLTVKILADSTSLAFGRTLVTLECAYCHMGNDGKLTGRLFNRKEDPFGEMWSANITQHPTKGIGRYKDGELAYLMRTGINPDGRFVGYMMCHPQMSDEQVASIIAFLRSGADILKPVDVAHPMPEYISSTMVKAFVMLGMYAPLPYDGKPKTAPPMSDKIAYGRYLATDVYGCANCHSASFETFNPMEPEKSPGYFAGGNPVPDEDFEITHSANLTMSKDFGLGTWTEEQFLKAVKQGRRNDGRILKNQMPRFVQIPDEEIIAIWAYLQTVPVMDKNALVAVSKK